VLRDQAWGLGCDREGRVTAGAVSSRRGRFVSGRSQADAAGGPPLPNTAHFNTPSGAASAGKALAVALGAPRISIPRGQRPCERGREDDIDQLHSFDIDCSKGAVRSVVGIEGGVVSG
jgi:hypothetical protein